MGGLFAAHGRMVLGLCRLLLRDATEAEDAAQQVFLSAHRSVLGGAVPRDPPAWLAAIARNECRARIRARMREPLALPELPDDLPDPLASAIRTVDLGALWAALSELPRRQRRAFLLRELGGLSYTELGAALGVTRPAVESLLFRARQQLRAALGGVNVALVPVALREQLAQLIPGFGSASAAAVPVAAKVAAVAAVAGLGATGVVATLPHHHAHAPQRSDRAQQQAAIAAPSPQVTISSPEVSRAAGPRQTELARRTGETGDSRRAETEHRSEPEHATTENRSSDPTSSDSSGSDSSSPNSSSLNPASFDSSSPDPSGGEVEHSGDSASGGD